MTTTSPFRSFPSLSTPSTTTSQEATIKTSIATCPLVEAIEERLCVYHNEEDCGEEELEDAQEQVIIDALQVQEDHQDAETKQLTMQYNQLKERQEIIEKAMNILRDTAATIGRDIENTIRSQEQARAKAQTYHDQKVSKLDERRLNTVNERLRQDLSRQSRLIRDISRIVDGASYGT